MKSRAIRIVLSLAIAISASAMLAAQLQLGGTNMAVSRAVTLSMPVSVSRGVIMRSFAMRVGGVAFDRAARPAQASTAGSLRVQYDATAVDGQRLVVTVNGIVSRPLLPDWQLVPIAGVVQSGTGSLVTLFGEMPSRAQAEAVRNKGGRIVNYHRELENKLLGLRMLQLDMLIFNPDSVQLPTSGTGATRTYLLGLGERRPNPATGRTAFESVQGYLSSGYQSYVVSDYQRDVTFGIVDGALKLTGTPYFYFWRSRSDSPNFEANGVDIVADEMRREYSRDVAARKVDSLSAWCRARIEQVQATKDFADLMAVPGEARLRLNAAQLSSMDEEARCEALLEVRYELEATRIVPLKQLSDSFSARTAEIEAINPVVWESAVRTMQYGAFFRYYRKTAPIGWEQFIASLQGVTPKPTVATPTEVYIPGERPTAASPRN